MRRRCLIAESTAQSGVLLTWPHACSDWQDDIDAVTAVYVEIAREITRREPLVVICYDSAHQRQVEHTLANAGICGDALHLFQAPTNDTWIRDYGPIAVSTGAERTLLDFSFNGWGNKHPAELDNTISTALNAAGLFAGTDFQHHSLVLEGGSIDTDGQGTLLTTARCLVHSGRNPGHDKHSLERVFHELMGTERVLWLDHGELEGDDTDAHIDMLARFCSPQTIAYLQCTDPDDTHYPPLAAMEIQLQSFRRADGEPYRLIPLPLPRPVCGATGQRLPASYCNFLVINAALLVPVYNDPADAVALERLAAGFPDREIIPINCLALIQQYGSLHCATMQLPEGFLSLS
jgi:agmatine/peptidylarginine deiminase